jgi:hypothetical protein
MDVTCDDCGISLRVGDWPYCGGNPSKHVSSVEERLGMLGEFHPYLDEDLNPGRGPVEIRSLAQRQRLMREQGVDYRGVKAGMPGSMV